MNAPARIQPVVADRCDLICSGFEHDGLMLDLYGDFDSADGSYFVQDVTLAGSDVSIAAVVSIEQMAKWSDQLGDMWARKN